MATKNFKQMSTNKLNKLMETASEEDKVLIQEVLDTRAAAKVAAEAPAAEAELTEEEKAAIAAAEAESGAINHEEKKVGTPKKERMSDEEREALVEKLRAEAVDHKCRVVPFNSIEWVDGVVVSIIEEKRNSKVLFAVKTDDGRRIVKAHDSKLIEILEETVERAKRTRGSRTPKLDENGNPIEAAEQTPWTDEEIEEAVQEVIGNVGKTVSFPEAGAYGQVAENAATLTGRIISLVPAKRTKTILYRIEVDQPDAEEGTPKKYAHKVSTLDSLEIAEELDEVGAAINEKFRARRYNESAPKEKMNKKQRFDYATNNLAKAKAALEKQQALVEKREKELAEAKAAYEEAIANGETFPEEEETVSPEASEENDGDLM